MKTPLELILETGLKVYIPTYGRVGKQKTIYEFPKELWGTVVNLVAPSHEDHGDLPTIVIPDEYEGSIAKKRQWVLEHSIKNGESFHIQIDDRATFMKRDVETRKTKPKEKFTMEDWSDIFVNYKRSIDEGYKFITLNIYFMQQNFPSIYYHKAGKFFCVDNEFLRDNDIKFTDVVVFEDTHVPLRILELGGDVIMYGDWIVVNTPGKGSGGTRSDDNFKDEKFKKNLVDFVNKHECVKVYPSNGTFFGRPCDIKIRIFWSKASKIAQTTPLF